MHNINDFRVGDRVGTHPATDAWMRGDRFGTVEKIGRKFVHVRLDRSNKIVAFTARNLRTAGDFFSVSI